jgi:L-ascorbate metabolism protein UlaG (beta-lactamase superfamily)
VARIEYVGHATVFVDLDGVRLLTDPLLRNRVAHLRRSTPVSARSRRGVDAVLISHAHYDHLDLPSLEKLGKQMPVVVPRGLGGMLRKRRFESVLEVAEGETSPSGRSEFARPCRATEAGARSGRPANRSATSSGLEVDLLRRRHGLFEGMGELGSIDVGLIPIWGWGLISVGAGISIRRGGRGSRAHSSSS